MKHDARPPTVSRGVQRKKRGCLACNRKFASTGPGNRICPICTSRRRVEAGIVGDAHRFHWGK